MKAKTPEEVQGKTCRTCIHRERWQCGGKVIQYCGVWPCRRTFNGKLKIKVTKEACAYYDEQTTNII
jgi:hypothetical protein